MISSTTPSHNRSHLGSCEKFTNGRTAIVGAIGKVDRCLSSTDMASNTGLSAAAAVTGDSKR